MRSAADGAAAGDSRFIRSASAPFRSAVVRDRPVAVKIEPFEEFGGGQLVGRNLSVAISVKLVKPLLDAWLGGGSAASHHTADGKDREGHEERKATRWHHHHHGFRFRAFDQRPVGSENALWERAGVESASSAGAMIPC